MGLEYAKVPMKLMSMAENLRSSHPDIVMGVLEYYESWFEKRVHQLEEETDDITYYGEYIKKYEEAERALADFGFERVRSDHLDQDYADNKRLEGEYKILSREH